MSYIVSYHHFVFGTKRNQPLLKPEIEARVFGFLRGICRNLGITCHAMNGVPNHIHLLLSLPATLSLADCARHLKASTSRWINEEKLCSGRFAWREGYSAFSVSPLRTAGVIRYIESQKIHHNRVTYRDEIEVLLKQSGLTPSPYDNTFAEEEEPQHSESRNQRDD
jgi:putative transposase